MPPGRAARAAAILCALAWTVLGSAACGGRDRDGRPDVVLIVVDTLRADHLGLYGYARPTSPRLDALAAGGGVFESAMAAAPWTLPSVMSIATARVPSRHGVVNDGLRLPAGVPTLAGTLRDAGYATGGFVSHIYVTAPFGFDRGFDRYEDFGLSRPGYRLEAGLEPAADHVTTAALEWVEGRDAAPLFLFVHYFDPHWPYDPPEPHRSLFPSDYGGPLDAGYDGISRFQDPLVPIPDDYRRFLVDRYDGEIHFVDAQIGRLLDGIAAARGPRPVAVAVTGDHGEEFKEHGSMGHGRQMYEEVVRVPLVIARGPLAEGHGAAARAAGAARGAAPRGGAARVGDPVGGIDIAPTLLDLAGVAPSAGMQGRSLAPLLTGAAGAAGAPADAGAGSAAPPGAICETVRLSALRQAIREGPLKLIHVMDENRAELFDLATDPHERHDLAAARPEDRRRLARALFERGEHLSGAWNLRWVGDGARRRFQGRIRAEGIIRSIVPLFTEPGRYRIDGASIVFADPGQDGESGFSFTTVPYEAAVTFELLIDGRPAPQAVLLGGAAARPGAMPFTLEGAPNSDAAFARPPDPPRPVPRFLLYRNRVVAAEEPVTLDEETRARLRSLGYVQ